MKCKKYLKIISQYVDGEITLKKLNKLNLHLDKCLDCKNNLLFLKKLKGNIKNLPVVNPPEDIDYILMKKIRNIPEKLKFNFVPEFRYIYASAAVAVILILILLFNLPQKSEQISLKNFLIEHSISKISKNIIDKVAVKYNVVEFQTEQENHNDDEI